MNPLVVAAGLPKVVYNAPSRTRDRRESRMAKLGWKQILGSIFVWVLFAPVILATGSPTFRLSLYNGAVLGIPTFLLLVVALLLILMVFMWILAGATFDEAGGQGDDQ